MRKVTIMVRFNRGGKFVRTRAKHAANGKLVPRRVAGMHSEIEGACRYYLRYTLTDGRRVYDPVGESSIEALAAANRKEIELFAALRSAEGGAPNSPPVPAARVPAENSVLASSLTLACVLRFSPLRSRSSSRRLRRPSVL